MTTKSGFSKCFPKHGSSMFASFCATITVTLGCWSPWISTNPCDISREHVTIPSKYRCYFEHHFFHFGALVSSDSFSFKQKWSCKFIHRKLDFGMFTLNPFLVIQTRNDCHSETIAFSSKPYVLFAMGLLRNDGLLMSDFLVSGQQSTVWLLVLCDFAAYSARKPVFRSSNQHSF